jgi:hypothetical protein
MLISELEKIAYEYGFSDELEKIACEIENMNEMEKVAYWAAIARGAAQLAKYVPKALGAISTKAPRLARAAKWAAPIAGDAAGWGLASSVIGRRDNVVKLRRAPGNYYNY